MFANSTTSSNISVSGCTVNNTDDTAFYLTDDADITATIDANPSLDGIVILGDLPTVTVTNNTFDNWGQATSRMKPDVAARITLDGNTVNAIGGAIAEVTAGTQTVSGSWNPAAGIYRVLGAVEIQGPADPTLTVDPNMEARFANFAYLQAGLSDDGGLMVLGTMGNEVLFTAGAASPARGQWYGVFLGANALPSTIQHTQIEWAGRQTSGYSSVRQAAGSLTLDNVTILEGRGSAVRVDGGTMSLVDSTISGMSNFGGVAGTGVFANSTTSSNISVSGCTVNNTDDTAFYLTDDADITATIDANPSLDGIVILGDLPTVNVTNNTFDNWGQATSRMKPDVAARITLDGNTVNAIGGAIAEVTAGTQTVSGTWNPAAGIYRVLGAVEIQGPADPTLTVDPNMEVRFANFALLRAGLSDDGGLMVLGTAASEVLFSADAASPGRGQWYGVFLGANALASTIQHAQIEWAGRQTSGYSSVRQAAGSLTLDNVTILEGLGSAVRVDGGTMSLTDSTISGMSNFGGVAGPACSPTRPPRATSASRDAPSTTRMTRRST